MVVMGHSGTVGVGAVVIQGRDVLSGIARGSATSRSASYVASRRAPSQAHLEEAVVVRRPTAGRRITVVHRGAVVDAACLPDILRETVLRGVGFSPIAKI